MLGCAPPVASSTLCRVHPTSTPATLPPTKQRDESLRLVINQCFLPLCTPAHPLRNPCTPPPEQKDEFLRLVINSVRNDLISRNEAFQCLALDFIANGGLGGQLVC